MRELAKIVDLANAAEPFEPAEIARLDRFSRKVAELGASQFLREPQSFKAQTDESGLVMYEIDNASREVVSAIVAPLRLLYSQRDNVSFGRIRNVIGRRASRRQTRDAQVLLSLLDGYKSALAAIMRVDPDMGWYEVDAGCHIRRKHEPSTKEIFEDWLYGEYLHDDEERLDRIDRWRGVGVHEFIFLTTARQLAELYVAFSDSVVKPILDEPKLAAA